MDFMNTIDSAILTINKNICSNIDKSEVMERGFLSQNILQQLRHFIEHISLKFYINGQDVEISYPNIQEAIKFVKARGKLKLLSRFHELLQITVSHYTLDEENSERLMLKYYEYLIKVKSLLKKECGLVVLENLHQFPLQADTNRDEYYQKIAERINQNNYTRRKSNYRDRYYIQKIRPFFVDQEVYYEVTFSRANDHVSKFDRIIAFTKHDITHNYSVKLTVSNDSIQILDRNMPIQIIEDWEVSIRPCEANNFAKILGLRLNIGNHKDFYNSMQYLTTTGLNLVELIDFSDTDFASVKQILNKSAKTTHFINILERCRLLSKRQQPGYNVLRYLLFRLNNKIIKKQYAPESCFKLSNLNLLWGCIPFDQMPFNTALINHNPKISDLFRCINSENRKHELLARLIKNNTEQKGVLFTPKEEITHLANVGELINTWNGSLYLPKHDHRRLETYKNHIFIKDYANNTHFILAELKKQAFSGIGNYTNSTESWLEQSGYEIDCEEKSVALKKLFDESKVTLIYGAAGTGKSTMINHISNRFKDYKKLYLANTNPAVDNLKRKVSTGNCTFQTIAKFLYNGAVEVDVLIIDECSTVSNSDMLKVLQKASFQLLVLVGDIFQIESILFGNWFSLAKDFVPESAVFELTSPYRTTNENLLTLWSRVRSVDERILECLTRNQNSVTLDESIFEPAQDDEIVLCLNYDGLYGINNINRFLQSSNVNPAVEWGTNIYKVGDPILFNETDRFSPLIYNNSKGKLAGLEVLEDNIQFDVEIEKVINEMDEKLYDFQLIGSAENGNSIIRFNVQKHKNTDEDDDLFSNTVVPFQVAYAVSIHKAQGLEFNSVRIVISDEVEEMISHNIFYTAITRARERLKIYWSPETEKKVLEALNPKSISKDGYLLKSKYGL